MKKLVALVSIPLFTLVVALLMMGAAGRVRAQDSSASCTWTFEATVRQGPNLGMILMGELMGDVAQGGALTGTIATQDKQMLNAAGQVMGRAISLAIEVPAETSGAAASYIFGTGAAWQEIAPATDCGGTMGGVFAGPQVGDIGDWIACVKIKGAGLASANHAKPLSGASACGVK